MALSSTSPEPSATSDSTSMGTSGSSVVEDPAQHAGGVFSCSRKGIGDWETGGGIGKAVGEGGERGMSMTGMNSVGKLLTGL